MGGGDDLFIDNDQGGLLGADSVLGGEGNDTLTGGGLVDAFVFRADFGQDQITDFLLGTDILQLQEAIWGGGLSAVQIVDQFGTVVNGEAVLDFGGGNTITFETLSEVTGLESAIFLF